MSDANAVKSLKNHNYAQDLSDAALLAFNAGVNMEMAINFSAYQKNLAALVSDGQITVQRSKLPTVLSWR